MMKQTSDAWFFLGNFAKRRHCGILLCALLLAGMVFLSGCGVKYTPVFQISLHQYAGEELTDSRIKAVVRDPLTEQQRAIYRNNFLDARRIVKGELKQDAETGRYGIVITVDKYAVSTLLHLTGETPGDPFAVTIDGFYVGSGRFPKRTTGTNTLELPPIWSRVEAEKIVEYIDKNYKHYNKHFIR